MKANAYGHGAADVAGAALGAGATGLCVATVAGGARAAARVLDDPHPCHGAAAATARSGSARDARLELVVSSDEIPPGVRVHLKLDTGMGRWGLSELAAPPFDVVGLMSHLATADTDAAYTEWQIDRFRTLRPTDTHLRATSRTARPRFAIRRPASTRRAAGSRCTVFRLSATDPAEDGLEPVLRGRSHLAQ